jgi:hypothetical protein
VVGSDAFEDQIALHWRNQVALHAGAELPMARGLDGTRRLWLHVRPGTERDPYAPHRRHPAPHTGGRGGLGARQMDLRRGLSGRVAGHPASRAERPGGGMQQHQRPRPDPITHPNRAGQVPLPWNRGQRPG